MLARPAATLLLLRDADDGIEVLMLERRLDSGFVPGAWVFPGGGLDPIDFDPAVHGVTDGPPPTESTSDAPHEGLAHRVAAVRETFEEAGVLLASAGDGAPVDPALVARLQDQRHRLEIGQLTPLDLATAHGLRFGTRALRPFAHWITPEGAPRRYDTRFFVTAVPTDQPATPCGREATSAHWITPTDALARHAGDDIRLILPTERCLHLLAEMPSTAATLAAVDRALAAGSPWVADRGGRRLDLKAPTGTAEAGSAA